EIGNVAPQLIERMGAFVRKRWEILDAAVIERRQPRARPPRLREVALDQPVSIEVVLDHGQSCATSGPDGSPNLFNFLVAPGPSINGVREPGNHQVAERHAAGLQTVHEGADLTLAPGNRRARHEHGGYARVLHTAHAGIIRHAGRESASAYFQATPGPVGPFFL